MPLGSTEEEQPPRLSSFKIGEPEMRNVINKDYSFLKLDQACIFCGKWVT